MPVDELVDPVGYSGWWTVLGIVLVLAAAAVVFLVLWLTRASAAEKAAPPPAPLLPTGPYDPYAPLRAEYEGRLDALAERFRAGELDERSLHLALSAEMRGFATGRLGQDASSMTLSEILFGPGRTADGTLNLIGALRRAMATTGYSDLKEFQRVEVVVSPYQPVNRPV